MSYDLHRPEWIYKGGIAGIPDEIMGRKATTAAVCGDSAWFGVYGYGLAEYQSRQMKWTLYSLDIREVAVSGIACSEDRVYAGISGHGILELDPVTLKKTMYRNGDESITNRYTEIAYFGNKIWAATESGLYVLDLGAKAFRLVGQAGSNPVVLVGDKIVTAFPLNVERAVVFYDATTEEVEKRVSIAEEVGLYGPLLYSNNLLFLLSNCGITRIDPETGEYKTYDGLEYLGKSRMGRIAFYEGNIVIGTDNGLLVLNIETEKWTLAGVNSGVPAGMQSKIVALGDNLFLATDTGPFILTKESFEQAMFLAEKHSGLADESGNESDKISRDTGTASKWININERDGLLNNSIYSILFTRTDLWVGTSVSGLNRISLEDYGVKTYLFNEDSDYGLHQPIVELEIYDNRIYHAGYDFFGEFDISGEKWIDGIKKYSDSQRVDSEGLYVDKDGLLMAVRKEGLWIRSHGEKEWEKITGSYLDTSPFMTDIIRIHNTHYISMDSGVQKFNLKKKKFKYLEAGVVDVKSLAGDGSSLWIGAKERNTPLGPQNTGLYRFNVYSGSLVEYYLLPGVRATHINDIAVDGPHVWVASEQGLFRLNRMTGEWTSYDGLPELPTGRVSAVSVYADTVAVGTDAGVFIKKTFLFQTETARNRFREAWELETNGNYAEAETRYLKLEDMVSDSMKDYLEFRRADCLYNIGNLHEAEALYESLLEKYPLLIADMENLFVESFEYDSYVRVLLKTATEFDEGSVEREYCNVHLKNVAAALVKVADRLRKDGKKERAADYWRFILELPDNLNGVKETKKEALVQIK